MDSAATEPATWTRQTIASSVVRLCKASALCCIAGITDDDGQAVDLHVRLFLMLHVPSPADTMLAGLQPPWAIRPNPYWRHLD